jgi:polysaccharide export outer membrane protein
MLLHSSCFQTSRLVYFNDIDQTEYKSLVPAGQVIGNNDLLSINVNSLNPEATIIFNAPNLSASGIHTTTAIGNASPAGYLVNEEGMISFPVIGKIMAAGLTKAALEKELVQKLKEQKLLIDPIVSIRLLNFRVSILGEVNRPGVYAVPNERLSVLEAIGLAGDITIYGKKENVLVIREGEDGTKRLNRLNLNAQEILRSPFYYLQTNDVIYVEPGRNRVQREQNQFLFPIIISLISLGIIVTDRIGG